MIYSDHIFIYIYIQAIEEVEREVERLLEVDATAEDVQYGMLYTIDFYTKFNFFLFDVEVVDNRDMDGENESDVGTQDIDIDDSDDESESDEDLAAAIDRDLEEMEEEDNEDEDDDDNDDEDEDEDESEDDDEEEGAQTGEIGMIFI